MQIHELFKTFSGPDLGAVTHHVTNFVNGHDVAAKSVSLINHDGGLLITVGYVLDTAHAYNVRFVNSVLGRPESEQALDTAIAAALPVDDECLCHALWVDATGNVNALFMVHD